MLAALCRGLTCDRDEVEFAGKRRKRPVNKQVALMPDESLIASMASDHSALLLIPQENFLKK